jgi:hypothetical protein
MAGDGTFRDSLGCQTSTPVLRVADRKSLEADARQFSGM